MWRLGLDHSPVLVSESYRSHTLSISPPTQDNTLHIGFWRGMVEISREEVNGFNRVEKKKCIHIYTCELWVFWNNPEHTSQNIIIHFGGGRYEPSSLLYSFLFAETLNKTVSFTTEGPGHTREELRTATTADTEITIFLKKFPVNCVK